MNNFMQERGQGLEVLPEMESKPEIHEGQKDLFLKLIPKFRKEHFVRSLMTACGINQKEFAKRHGLNPSDVSKVISGLRRTEHIRRAIANELGVSHQELWSNFR